MSPNVKMSFSAISVRSFGNFSTTSLWITLFRLTNALVRCPLDVPNECNDINGRWVIGITQKVHQDVNYVGSNLGEPDGTSVNALNQKLSVFDALVKVLFGSGLQLLLEE
jgi:hypothetical protein